MMKTHAWAAASLLAAGLPASAQIRPAPELGLWESTSKMLVNGRDVMADLRSAQARMMEKMRPEQRAQFEAMMKQQGGNPFGDTQQECLVAKDLEKWSRPEARLREAERDAQHCKFEPVSMAGSKLEFKGRCADPQGFTGDVTGQFTMQSAKAWTFVYTGKGTMAPGAGIGNASRAGGPVEMRMESNARWVSANCGTVKPAP